MASQLFVYYRVRAEHHAAAVAALRRLHATWRLEDPALDCELLQRVDATDRPDRSVTLMETYRRADGVTPSWQARIEREAGLALAPWLVGERHIEVFAPCA